MDKDIMKMNKRELREEIAKLCEVNAELKDKLDKMEYARYLSLRFSEDGECEIMYDDEYWIRNLKAINFMDELDNLRPDNIDENAMMLCDGNGDCCKMTMQDLFMKYPIGSEIRIKYSEYETDIKIVRGYEQIGDERYLITDGGRVSVKRLNGGANI